MIKKLTKQEAEELAKRQIETNWNKRAGGKISIDEYNRRNQEVVNWLGRKTLGIGAKVRGE